MSRASNPIVENPPRDPSTPPVAIVRKTSGRIKPKIATPGTENERAEFVAANSINSRRRRESNSAYVAYVAENTVPSNIEARENSRNWSNKSSRTYICHSKARVRRARERLENTENAFDLDPSMDRIHTSYRRTAVSRKYKVDVRPAKNSPVSPGSDADADLESPKIAR